MSVLARLRTLRQQAGAANLPIPRLPESGRSERIEPAASAEAEALVARLRQALARRAYHEAMQNQPVASSIESTREIGLGERIAPGLRLIETDIPDPQDASVDLPWLDRSGVARADLAAFDIETSGMNAGVGTRAFLVGIADWNDDHLRVRQLLLETPSGEARQLALLADWLGGKQVLLSYNGKSFDVPLMNSRYPLFGQRRAFEHLAHLDFLPIVRRRYRAQLSNCKLGTVERELLGIVRTHDLPSAEVPRAWRDWLLHGREHALKLAIAHHRQDLISLWRLLDRLGMPATNSCGK